MSINFARNALFGTTAAALVAGSIAGSAQAAVRFSNVADRPIVFTMRCATLYETYPWTIDQDHTLTVTCNNGASQAMVQLYTSDGNITSRVVSDGDNYQVGFNDAGDATIIPEAW